MWSSSLTYFTQSPWPFMLRSFFENLLILVKYICRINSAVSSLIVFVFHKFLCLISFYSLLSLLLTFEFFSVLFFSILRRLSKLVRYSDSITFQITSLTTLLYPFNLSFVVSFCLLYTFLFSFLISVAILLRTLILLIKSIKLQNSFTVFIYNERLQNHT